MSSVEIYSPLLVPTVVSVATDLFLDLVREYLGVRDPRRVCLKVETLKVLSVKDLPFYFEKFYYPLVASMETTGRSGVRVDVVREKVFGWVFVLVPEVSGRRKLPKETWRTIVPKTDWEREVGHPSKNWWEVGRGFGTWFPLLSKTSFFSFSFRPIPF